MIMYAKSLPTPPKFNYPYQEQQRCSGSFVTSETRVQPEALPKETLDKIAASVRNPIHITDCALAGADIATVPYKVIEQMTHHPLTDQGIEKFKKDYVAVFGA